MEQVEKYFDSDVMFVGKNTVGICQLNVSHFRDVVYCAMSSSDYGICQLSVTIFRTMFAD